MSGPVTTQEFKLPDEEEPEPSPDGPVSVQGLETGLAMSPYMKALVYGPPGSGKTLLAATAPAPLILDTENSSETLWDWPDHLARCEVRRVKEWNPAGALIEQVRLGEFPDRKTLVVDTITEMRFQNLDALLSKKANAYTPEGKDYQTSGEMLRRIMLAVRDLDMHVIVLAHVMEDETSNGSHFMRPSLPPKLYDVLKGVFGLIGFLGIKQQEWDSETPFMNALQTRETNQVQAKTRYKYLPPVMENPTWPDIMEQTKRWNREGEWLL